MSKKHYRVPRPLAATDWLSCNRCGALLPSDEALCQCTLRCSPHRRRLPSLALVCAQYEHRQMNYPAVRDRCHMKRHHRKLCTVITVWDQAKTHDHIFHPDLLPFNVGICTLTRLRNFFDTTRPNFQI